ncbi:protein kinase STUNTED-like [Malus sylvestris]|uniref:protein kinase STUNTED-like n=1 Tax=Malus sylvestris TaxID=3752 RepID=UPI0021ABCB12|nr:protein kinase STUNTED-like [Malus sylvestris]
MKLLSGTDGAGGGGGGKTVVVGVKLDSHSKELLTWALVKVAETGDNVVAIHVLEDHLLATSDGTSSLLSLVKTFDSVLSAYEGFCNLKQVDLKLKVCRGHSVRKLLVREAKAFHAATTIVGTSKTHHRIGSSSTSVAKYCARKLSKNFSVFAVDNGKIVFKRVGTDRTADQFQGTGQNRSYVHTSLVGESLSKNAKAPNDSELNQCRHFVRKSCSKCGKKTLQINCETCVGDPVLLDNSGTKLADELPAEGVEDNSLALVPIQRLDLASNSFKLQDSQCLKPGWSLIRQAFLPKRQHVEKSEKKTSVFRWVLRPLSWHTSSVIYPDQKQNNSCHGEDSSSVLDGISGAIVPFEPDAIYSPLFPNHGNDPLPEEFVDSCKKFSSSCRLFSYEELLSATSNFIPENMVGKGGSSYVYRGCLLDGKEWAVKILKLSGDILKEFVHEIEIIKSLNHKNIISLVGFCFEENHLLLVYDFISRGSLEENLHGNKKDANAFGWKQRYNVAIGVAKALDYLHNGCEEPVIHRDVKSSNILLSDDFEPQLSDFGLACSASVSTDISCTDVAGTFGYLAPEYFMHGKVSDKIDVYAFGVVVLEILSGRKPIFSKDPKGQESLVMWAKPILKSGNVAQLLDPSLGIAYDHDQIERMILAANLCIRHAPGLRPNISVVLKLLQGDEEVTRWARQVSVSEEDEAVDGEAPSCNIQSHLNLALRDLEDDSVSVSSGEQSIALEDYLQGRWSRSSSFN